MTTLDNDFSANLSNVFCCKFCHFSTSRKYNYKTHLNSIKHKNNANNNENNGFSAKLSKTYNCQNCNKHFNDRAGLWRHKKICNQHFQSPEKMNKDELIVELLKQNKELFEIIKNGTTNNSNNVITNVTNSNSNNKAFNLNFFLNETCKNAMNISDFVDSLQLELSDLESIGTLGYVDGISKIIVKNLKALDESERPIHCTDKKRITVYIKNQDKWEKDDENKTQLRKAINYVAHENTLLIPQWKAKHPDYLDSSSLDSDKYNNMVIEVLGGEDDSNVSEDKIIRKIAKEVMIGKHNM